MSQEIKLPKSGQIATIREGKGRDILRVQKNLGKGKDIEDMFMFALIAELTLIDGNKIAAEHLLDMPLADVLELQKAVAGDNFLSLTPATSPNSDSSSDSTPAS